MNRRTLDSTIKIIKASILLYCRGLITFEEIRDAIVAHRAKEREKVTPGVPIDRIQSIFWCLDKGISNRVLELWLKKFGQHLEVKGHLQAHEFLYLLVNGQKRSEYQQKPGQVIRPPKHIMKAGRTLQNMEGNVNRLWSIETRIQSAMDMNFEPAKATIETKRFESLEEREKMKKELIRNMTDLEKAKQKNFRVSLRSQETEEDIKNQLRIADRVLLPRLLNGADEKQKANEELKDFLLNNPVAIRKIRRKTFIQNQFTSGNNQSNQNENSQHFSQKKLTWSLG